MSAADASDSPGETRRIIFRGRVQGVGFRYTSCSFARRLPLAGYVRNLPDKSVELVAQGPTPAIDELIAQLQQHFGSQITHIERQSLARNEQYSIFDIR